MTLFPFVQLEFTSSVGPDAGRYVVAPSAGDAHLQDGAPPVPAPALGLAGEIGGYTRAESSADVLVIAVSGGRPARPRVGLRRKPQPTTAGTEPREVPLQLATFIEATAPFADKTAAVEALTKLRGDEQRQNETIAQALEVLNRAVRAHRIAAADPYVVEVTREDARDIRLGYGTAAELYAGEWSDAFTPAPPGAGKLSRAEKLRPTEAVAAVLVGRAQVLEGEDVTLRALLEHRHGRLRAAALLTAAGLDLLASELSERATHDAAAAPLAGLEADVTEARVLADRAREHALDDDAAEAIERLAMAGLRIAHDWRYGVVSTA